ncbi:phospholipid carrier-dependent glycosyltransferase [Paenibacillus psychroresistens]|uniref:Polyprenol-phosphate-mannose--protein mannosyltransferase n=1 Tax=Paenibacillus psychroresistens TaxID=1778678 RepID=A0A6B8RIH1_9BACL|nr:glycosyltransferase family 39 protein [Paenibacillus psychroresistens]QGQ95333.1 phospholipid carrier-dependent glycosyltransferase [Paenibacillus psychroresistens]
MQSKTVEATISAFPDLLLSLLFFIVFALIYIAIIRQNKLGTLSKGRLNGLLVFVLLFAGLIRGLIVYKYSGHIYRIDILPIAADIIAAWLIYCFAVKPLGKGIALGVCLLFAMNPAVMFHASVSFQATSYFIMCIVVVIFAISSLRRFILSILGSIFVLTAALLTGMFQFSTFKPWLWIAQVVKHVFVTDTYATLNVFNLFALTGGNGFAASNERMLLSYNIWGLILLAGAFIYLGFFIKRIKQPLNLSKVIFILLLFVVSVFVLAPHMRISYLYPAIPLAIFSYILTQDRRLLQLLFGFSVTHFINSSFAHAYSKTAHPLIPHVEGILMVVSLTNVVLLIYLIYSGYDIFIKQRILKMEIVEFNQPEPNLQETSNKLLTRKDWIWMSTITLIYTLVAFYNLGSLKEPETFWKPVSSLTFYVDLGKSQTIERVNAFVGIGEGKLKLEFGEDTPDTWKNPLIIETKYTTVFKWIVQPVNYSARYVKVTVDKPGFTLNELAIYGKYTDKKLPMKIEEIHSEGLLPLDRQEIKNVFDEQNEVVYKPTFMNESYFDEIYHPRTAYEHLHLIKPYETTHPPLGKLLIAVGIKIFGMNPFGWRVIGTLFGIGMLPMMYVFAKRLFGRTSYAWMATFLIACDFMHFAQTRIGTIDVYGVFFIILMYYFMLRFYQLSFYKATLSQTLRPLFLSGLFFGIGAASKWIVIYGGAGLALIFLLTLYDRYREYEAAKKLLNQANSSMLEERYGNDLEEVEETMAVEDFSKKIKAEQIVGTFSKLAVKTVAWCSLFFIIVPVIIYSLSFFPIMAVPGQDHTVKQLIKYQTDMFDYHSKLVATHPFSSAWWEWPLIMRPIWYYNGKEVSDGNVSSIASFGNPAIWWVGLLAVIAAIFVSRQRKDKGMFVVLIAYFSQYVPWMLVSRLTFIYHYFAMVPFLILCIVYMIKVILEKKPDYRIYVAAYLTLVLGLFVMFYPVLSGMVVDKGYVNYVLRWFDSWTF